jgi:phosphoesterase RecJ-like protein
MNPIRKWIQKSEKIILLRHKDPDWDAYGSQFGMYFALKETFPKKNILAAGDSNALNCFQPMDPVSREDYRNALVIIMDTVAKSMLLNDDFVEAEKVVLIDHHLNEPDVRFDEMVIDRSASSCSEIVFHLLKEWKLPIPVSAARALMIGIISDTGRFLYNGTNSRTFSYAGELMKFGVNLPEIYEMMYTEPLNMKKVKAAFFNSVQYTPHQVAYRKNDRDFMLEHQVDVQTVSRGLVNQMAGAKEVRIWANFTFDERIGKILCEIRSRNVSVVDVARKYGGGGHAQACGCTVETWEDTDRILADLDQIAEGLAHGQTTDSR